MTDYGLPFVEIHQGCPHLETKWVRCHDCERKRCLRCGGLLPTCLGVRYTAGKRKLLARQRKRPPVAVGPQTVPVPKPARPAFSALRCIEASMNAEDQMFGPTLDDSVPDLTSLAEVVPAPATVFGGWFGID